MDPGIGGTNDIEGGSLPTNNAKSGVRGFIKRYTEPIALFAATVGGVAGIALAQTRRADASVGFDGPPIEATSPLESTALTTGTYAASAYIGMHVTLNTLMGGTDKVKEWWGNTFGEHADYSTSAKAGKEFGTLAGAAAGAVLGLQSVEGAKGPSVQYDDTEWFGPAPGACIGGIAGRAAGPLTGVAAHAVYKGAKNFTHYVAEPLRDFFSPSLQETPHELTLR